MNLLETKQHNQWPQNLLLDIFEEEDWNNLIKKLPIDYHGTLEYLLLTYFGEKPARIIRMVYQEMQSTEDVAKAMKWDEEMTSRIIHTQVKRLQRPYYSWQILHGISGNLIREQAYSEQKGFHEGYHDGYRAALEDVQKAEEDKYAESNSDPVLISPGNLKHYNLDLCLPLRLHNRLLRAGYETIEDLQRVPFEFLLAILGVDYKDGCMIANAIREAGYSYRGGEEDLQQ